MYPHASLGYIINWTCVDDSLEHGMIPPRKFNIKFPLNYISKNRI